jgi:hypothetical protein
LPVPSGFAGLRNAFAHRQRSAPGRGTIVCRAMGLVPWGKRMRRRFRFWQAEWLHRGRRRLAIWRRRDPRAWVIALVGMALGLVLFLMQLALVGALRVVGHVAKSLR